MSTDNSGCPGYILPTPVMFSDVFVVPSHYHCVDSISNPKQGNSTYMCAVQIKYSYCKTINCPSMYSVKDNSL